MLGFFGDLLLGDDWKKEPFMLVVVFGNRKLGLADSLVGFSALMH